MGTFKGEVGLLTALANYRQARFTLLDTIGLRHSNRDPLSEFSESLVAEVLGAQPAESRVQTGYDLTTADGIRVDVKYLANPENGWKRTRNQSKWDLATVRVGCL